MQGLTRASVDTPEAAIVIPILEAISNSVSALPLAISVGQASSVQRTGGFRSAFVAAQGLSTASHIASDESEGLDGIVAENAGAGSNLKGSIPGSGNPQPKKLMNSDTVAASIVAAINIAVPGFTPETASQIPSLLAQPTLSQPSLTDQSPLPTLTAAQTQSSDGTAGAVHSRLQTEVYDSEPQSTPGVLIPSGTSGKASGQQTSKANSAQPTSLSIAPVQTVSGTVLPELILSGEGNESQGGLRSAEPMQRAGSSPPPSFSATNQQSTSGTVMPSIAKDSEWSGIQADSFGLESREKIQQTNQAAGNTAPGPTLLANADSEAGAPAAVQAAFAAKVNIGQENSANAVVPDIVPDIMPDAGVQSDITVQTGTNPLSAMMNGQIPFSSDPSPGGPLASTRAAMQFAVPVVTSAVTSASVRAGAGARTSSMPAALLTGSSSEDGSPIGSQTPFSVFFSGPGPGVESAASVLPKMILPAAGSAIRDGRVGGGNASSASPQANGFSSATSQSVASQSAAPPSIASSSVAPSNIASPNMKDSLSATASGSLQTAQGLRRDADLNAATAQLAASQTGGVPVSAPAPPSAAAVTLALAQAAPATESLPKPDPLPAAAPASIVPAAAETLPAAIVGPVQMAQLINRIGQSEMRIGMNTSAFGSVEVRTVVHANDVGLVIGSEKGDLRTLLTNDMPAITNTLQQQNLRLNSVNFMQGFAFSNNASGGGDSQQRSFVPMRAPSGAGLSEATVDDSLELSLAGEFAGGGLSILA
jgi:hypothetical protein